MKTMRTLLTLLVVSMCAMQSAWARVAPSLPEGQTPTDGQTYYLYNVMEGKFLCRSMNNSDYVALGTYGEKVTLTATDEEKGFMIKWADNNYFLLAYDTYIESWSSAYSWYDFFTISKSSKGYTIQRSSKNTDYYVADEYVGYNGANGDRVTPALAEGSIHWLFIAADEGDYYIAKHKLYTYLEVADQYNFYTTQYEQVYENPASTTAEIDFAQQTLENALSLSQNYVSPSWTEYPILFQNNTENKWENDGNSALCWNAIGTGAQLTSTLTATVNVDANATLAYSYSTESGYTNLRVFLDGELVQNISNNQSYNNGRRYFVALTPGKHDIAWTCVCNDPRSSYWNSSYLSQIGIVNTPTITPATTTVEGQLGTEVLKLVDPVSSVRRIVINGVIGEDDWTTIGLMVNAFSIDMSGATATSPIPAYMFTGEKFPFLYDIKLPQGLTAIGEDAFNNSNIENEITFPETLQTIGNDVFNGSKIKAAYMADGITSVDYGAFADCRYLENATWSAAANVIPDACFSGCYNLRTFTIPEGVTNINYDSFRECYQFNPRFPKSIQRIEYGAFSNTATDSLIINENVTVNYNAFSNCGNLVYAEWPTSFFEAIRPGYYDGTNGVVIGCTNLNKAVLKSPTVVTYDSQYFFNGITLSNITLQVPDYLVSAYKLDPYWYQCNVVGFNSADVSDWILNKPLVLNEGQRIGGTPNIDMQQQSTLTFNGDTPQTLGNLDICHDWYYSGNWNTMVLSNTNSVNISGNLTYRAYTEEKCWTFLCLPFDTKVGDINSESSFAIRYYDGATRATNGAGGNWKNYTAEDIIPAGTGFILQTSKQCSTYFTAMDNASKQNLVSKNEFVKPLAANLSEVTANKGWNLVGNPWTTYYNIHKVNFTAPLTVWNGYDRRYDAYSIIDDDYAIKPLEAIFVQCPDEVEEISFPIDGRQLTEDIESQNAARSMQPSSRKLIDVELSDGSQSDKTRFVLNPQASLSYEVNCDASKFMSMDAGVPQIYTIENGVQMAINERPVGEGVVRLGVKIAANGTYTISAPRNGFSSIILYDSETGEQTDLSSDSYTFSAYAGSYDNRFALYVGSSVITKINGVGNDAYGADRYYNLNGQRIGQPQKGVNILNGKKIIVK